MHSGPFGNWVCGPGSIFSGFHFGGFISLLFWGIVLFLLFRIGQSILSADKANKLALDHPDSALSILEKRYASGEIDQAEFLQRKKDLKG